MSANWETISFADLITERKDRFDPDAPEIRGLTKIEKIDFFEGKIYLGEYEPTKTQQIIVEPGDFVFSGLNIEKGAASFNETGNRLVVSANYSTCSYDDSRVNLEFFKHYMRSNNFQKLLKANLKKDYGFTRPKHLMPLTFLVPRDKHEQQRIVAKYEQCKETCSGLEHELTHQETLLAKLQQAILQEAIQGKLTADWRAAHPDVEPASQLLHRIQAEKARLIAAKKLRPEKPLPKITAAEIPFAIPKTWEWCRIGDQIKISGGSQPNKGFFIREPREGYTRFIQIRDFKSDDYKTYIPTKLANRLFTKNDILIGRYGPPVFQILRGLEGTYNVALMKAEPRFGGILNDFLFYLLQEPRIQSIVVKESERTAGQTGIRLPLLNEIVFPLPPLAEQAAIVARVETLLGSSRLLAAEIAHTRTHAAHLLQAVLKEAFSKTS